MKSRLEIEKEVSEDLKKPLKQLLADIYQEILHKDCEGHSLHENAIHAMKRFSSLVTRSIIISNKLQNKVKLLTYIIIGLVVIQIIIGVIQVWPSIK